MNKIIGIISAIIFTISFTPLNCLALHDDETIGKGGAWKSDNIKTDQPVSSDNEESIDRELDKAFKKSPLVIPAIKKESDESETISTDIEEIKETGSKEN